MGSYLSVDEALSISNRLKNLREILSLGASELRNITCEMSSLCEMSSFSDYSDYVGVLGGAGCDLDNILTKVKEISDLMEAATTEYVYAAPDIDGFEAGYGGFEGGL